MTIDTLLPGRLQATFWPAPRVPADGHVAFWGSPDDAAALRALGLTPGEAAVLPTVLPRTPRARTRVAAADVPARLLGVRAALPALARMPPGDEWPAWQRPSDSVLAWSLAAKLALEWVAAGRVVPSLRAGGPDLAVAWTRAVPPGDGRLADLAAALPPAAHALRADEGDEVWAPAALLAAFTDAVADTCARTASGPAAGPGGQQRAGRGGTREPSRGAQPVPAAGRAAAATALRLPAWPQHWAGALAGHDPTLPLDDPGAVDAVAAWQASVARRDGQAAARLCLRLHTPDDAPAPDTTAADTAAPDSAATDSARTEPPASGAAATAPVEPDTAPAAPWPLVYLLQAADDPSLLVPAEQVWSERSASLELLGRRVGDPQETLVRGLADAARLFAPVDRSLSEARPASLELSTDEVADLLGGADHRRGATVRLRRRRRPSPRRQPCAAGAARGPLLVPILVVTEVVYLVATGWVPKPRCASSVTWQQAISSPSRRRVSIALGNGRRLSKLATEGRGRPSPTPTDNSLGTPRTRVVTGATSTRCMTSLAASRLTTRNGRPLSSGVSPHHSSPRATTTAPRAPPRSPRRRASSRRRSPPAAPDGGRHRRRTPRRCAQPQTGARALPPPAGERVAAERGVSMGAVIREAVEAYTRPHGRSRQEAAQALFALGAPVADWEAIKAEILRGSGG